MKIRIRWSDWIYYQPIRITVTGWDTAKAIKYGKSLYFIVDAVMEYKARPIELCMPYHKFVTAIKFLKPEWRRGLLEITKTYRWDNYGMVIKNVVKRNIKI